MEIADLDMEACCGKKKFAQNRRQCFVCAGVLFLPAVVDLHATESTRGLSGSQVSAGGRVGLHSQKLHLHHWWGS